MFDGTLDFREINPLPIPPEAKAHASIVPVVLLEAGISTFVGSAGVIGTLSNGQYILATARHVVAKLEEYEESQAVQPFVMAPRDLSSVAGTLDIGPIHVEQVCIADTFSDVGLLVTEDPSRAHEGPRTLRPMPPSFGSPNVGEECLAFGYPQTPDNAQQYRLLGSLGDIVDVHPSGRDPSLINYPSFQTSGLYMPAMSGGPALSGDGRVIGVISRAWDLGNEPIPLGYAALMGSIAELKLELALAGAEREYSIPELAAGGVFGNSPGFVRLSRNERGVALDWTS